MALQTKNSTLQDNLAKVEHNKRSLMAEIDDKVNIIKSLEDELEEKNKLIHFQKQTLQEIKERTSVGKVIVLINECAYMLYFMCSN